MEHNKPNFGPAHTPEEDATDPGTERNAIADDIAARLLDQLSPFDVVKVGERISAIAWPLWDGDIK